MGDTSRKVKNPLLSAAGVSFPFEDFSGSALLMPVTPATPSILQDEGEIASFVGQSSQTTEFNLGSNNTHAEINLHQQIQNPSISHQQPQFNAPLTSEISLTPFNEPRNLTSEPQPQKQQGYLSSFLSSLPNLALSSITGDREEVSAKSSLKDQTSVSSEYNSYNPSYYSPGNSYSGTSYNPNSGPPISYQENSYETTVPSTVGNPNWYSPDNIPPTNVSLTPNPPVQPPPVALPPTGAASASYRLGNQRRLKYAPPPDLTTSNPRVNNLPINLPPQPTFSSAPAPALFQQQNVIPQIRNAPLIGLGVEQNQNYNREIPRSSPVVETAISASTPQNIPPRFSTIGTHLEPATPQNTPANTTNFSSFVPPTSVSESHWNPSAQTSAAKRDENDDNNVLREIDLGDRSSSALFPGPESVSEGIIGSERESPPSSSSPFAPISAARVSEKLENLLASRNEEIVGDSEVEKPAIYSPPITGSANDSNSGLINPNNTYGGIDPPAKSLNEDKKPIVGYFTPTQTTTTPTTTTTIERNTSIPSFYDPTKFQEQVKPLGSCISDQQKKTFGHIQPAGLNDYGFPSPIQTNISTDKNTAPTFYNPTQFASSSSTNFNANLKPQIYPTTVGGNFPSSSLANNPQSYFYPGNTIPDNNIGRQENTAGYFTPPSPPPMTTSVPEPTGSATLDPIQMSVNPLGSVGYSNTNVDNGLSNLPPSLHNLASGTSAPKQMIYRPVYQHWFHRKEVETKILWIPFSMQDSLNLEEVHNSTEITPETTVATDGGRYDVDILRRLRTPVYWSGTPNEVRRCSWFYKGPTESRYVPYEENVSARLEEEFQQACNNDVWNRRIELNNGEYIIFHSPTVQVHYLQPGSPELTSSWGNNTGAVTRPRVVKRGVDEFNIDEGEPDQVDHLLFLVHGIGSVCDLKFRSVEEVVDEFRSISLQLVQSHYRSASEQGTVHKIEVLPISWHTTLHSEDTGIDKKLQAITLESIPKLRHFTNDTLSDILFYTSPIYCQTIMQTVGNEMNRLYTLFKKRNSTFQGGVYVGGHSLGSLILFDLLCHQKPPKEEEIPENVEEEGGESANTTEIKEDTVAPASIRESRTPMLKRRLSRRISYVMGAAGTGQPFINYPQLNFNPSAFFALGSPIGMFVTVRGIDNLGEEFSLPTCPAFFNIFHPFDPVAYRVEALINPDASKFRPKLIPHHKGRKRMHLELKETMARVGADLKQKLLDSVRSTWNSVYQLAMFHRPDNQALEREIDKVVEEQLQSASANESETSQQQIDDSGDDVKIGKLNGGRRIDYVLQEAPFEYINEYIFALTSHVCYWESEDTMLMMLKEIYGSMGIQSDAQLPQQTLTIERASLNSPAVMSHEANIVNNTASTNVYSMSSNNNTISSGINSGNSSSSSGGNSNGAKLFDAENSGMTSPMVGMGMDPTAPISDRPIGPPPISGFMRKL